MEYIYKKTGELITNTEAMEKALKEVYTEDMFEASLTETFKPLLLGGVYYGYGAALRALDDDRFKTDYRNMVKIKAENFIVKGEPTPECADHFKMVDDGFNFTDAMMKLVDGETVWATSVGLGLSTVCTKPYYFRIICGELCYTLDPDEPLVDWDAVVCLLRHVDFTDEIWHSLSKISEKE